MSDVTISVDFRLGGWDPKTRCFDPLWLRSAIVARRWTVSEFAVEAKLTKTARDRALAGLPIADVTTIRILSTLELRQPMKVA